MTQNGKVEFTPEQQAEVNRIVQERLARDRKKREAPPVYIIVVQEPGVIKRLLNKFKRS